MNPLNRFCQLASLLCCMVLGAEGFLFVHNLNAQIRPSAQTFIAKVDKPHSTAPLEITKVAVN